MKKLCLVIFLFLSLNLYAFEEEKKIIDSIEVLDKFMAIPEESIPKELLKDAKAIAIIPNVIRAGFIIGGRYGKGLLLIKNIDNLWSNPIFLILKGGSFGWQIGAQSIDIILVFKTKESVNELLNGKITLGADASVAAGPIGREVSASTDIKLHSEIYSYSRSKGFYLGLSLVGAVIEVDENEIMNFYKTSNIQKILYKNLNNIYIDELKKRLYEYSR